MKKFEEVAQEVTDVRKQIRETEDKKSALHSRWAALINKETRKSFDEIKAISKQIDELDNSLHDLALKLKILENNVKIALYHDTISVAFEVLKKYKGKPYGEKTREKICNEFNAITGGRLYINRNYSTQYIKIYKNMYDIDVSFEKYTENPFLLDNKIQGFNVEDLHLQYVSEEYVEFVDAKILDIKAAYQRVLAAKKELKKVCDEYNSLVVGDIRHLTAEDRFCDFPQ